MQTYYSYDNVKFWFLPTSSHLLPLYLNTNKSPLAAVVVNVGAVSSLNSYTAFHVSVLEPVPSCITVRATNCPAAGEVPLGAAIVLLAPRVTFATGDAITSHAIVA
jgi:hypothetical protein